LPHSWLVDEHGRRISTLDITGHGRLTLLTGFAGAVWARAVERLALAFLGLRHDRRAGCCGSVLLLACPS
jgi:hypothetical protein